MSVSSLCSSVGSGPEMSLSLPPSEALVRPRFTDGTFDSPLLLEEHFAELFLSGDKGPRTLVITGKRGSGMTTALGILSRAAARAGKRGEGIDFFDFSTMPLVEDVSERAQLYSRIIHGRLPSVRWVVAGPRCDDLAESLRARGYLVSLAKLAPWGADELVELLS